MSMLFILTNIVLSCSLRLTVGVTAIRPVTRIRDSQLLQGKSTRGLEHTRGLDRPQGLERTRGLDYPLGLERT